MPTQAITEDARRRPGAVTDTNVLARRWRERRDNRAREELVERYLPLARKLASRYAGPNEPFEDLVQVASLGLLQAIDRFDPQRGTTLRSFAIPTILGELKRYFRNTGWSVHVPRGAQELALRVDQATREIAARSGRNPRVQELAEYLEVSAEEILNGIDAGSAHYAKSLDAPLGPSDEDESQAMIDTIGQSDGHYELVEMTGSVAAAVGQLPDMERRAFLLRLAHDMRQSDIARELGCSQMHVSRLLRRATARVREIVDPVIETLPTG
jgi:RNA polymerase sigma-B factor